jgi:hypothetical protein
LCETACGSEVVGYGVAFVEGWSYGCAAESSSSGARLIDHFPVF